MLDIHNFDIILTPNKIKFNNTLYNIIQLHKKYVIKGFKIKTFNKTIDELILNTIHPNCNPKTFKFCLPNEVRKLKLNNNSIEILKLIMCCFNLDDCYFTPWDEIKYKKCGEK